MTASRTLRDWNRTRPLTGSVPMRTFFICAEAALAMRSYGLIVCDLKLPDAQGLDVLRRLRAACPGGVTVVVSGDADRVAAFCRD